MKYFALLYCLLFLIFSAFTESRYTYSLEKEILLGTLALGVSIPSLFIPDSPGKDISSDKNRVNAFDRNLMFSYSKPLGIAGDVAVYGLAVSPIISLIGNITDLNAVVTYTIMYGEAMLLTFGTTEIIKKVSGRNRPYTYFDGLPAGLEKDYYKSFPSRHTAIAFMSAGFLSSTFFMEYPDSAWKIPVIAGSYGLAAGIGALRIASGNHFLTDVLAGAAIGSLYGWLIPFLHLRKKDIDSFAVTLTAHGFLLNLRL
ncbi:MAG: phosphatase PAP2 family protein [Spirochaetaceae bacterium]|jgi:membrane-associated phospholipid phosphatase|nr:phosphatase PAP2 family protein [Spirochaetaceae bacterium]